MALYFLVLTLVHLAVAGEKSKEVIKIWPQISEFMANQPTRATYPQMGCSRPTLSGDINSSTLSSLSLAIRSKWSVCLGSLTCRFLVDCGNLDVNLTHLPIGSMYGIVTYMNDWFLYGKCMYIFHTWMVWVRNPYSGHINPYYKSDDHLVGKQWQFRPWQMTKHKGHKG